MTDVKGSRKEAQHTTATAASEEEGYEDESRGRASTRVSFSLRDQKGSDADPFNLPSVMIRGHISHWCL